MRILFVARQDLLTKPGGDTVQLLKTREQLEARGLTVEIAESLSSAQSKQYDIFHLFNVQNPENIWEFFDHARRNNIRTVISPIWWNLSYAKMETALHRLGVAHLMPRTVMPILKLLVEAMSSRARKMATQILENCDLILPNSAEEMEVIRKEFGLTRYRSAVVKNAIDADIFVRQNGRNSRPRSVICCARVEPTKNQYRLIQAVERLDSFSLTLVGRPGTSKNYNRLVREAVSAQGHQWIEGHLSQEDLVPILNAHEIHALVSFRESPGLASLEALALGLNLVVSGERFCPVKTYFENRIERSVFVCNPYDVEDIAQALNRAHYFGVNNLPIEEEFTWRSVGEATYSAYRTLYA